DERARIAGRDPGTAYRWSGRGSRTGNTALLVRGWSAGIRRTTISHGRARVGDGTGRDRWCARGAWLAVPRRCRPASVRDNHAFCAPYLAYSAVTPRAIDA